MNNLKIRNALKKAGIKQWELADLLGCAESTLCIKLRRELPDEEQQRIISIINENAKVGK